MNMIIKDNYIGRKYLYISKSVDGDGYDAVNYDAGNCHLNSFLTLFDINHNNGHFKLSGPNRNKSEVWFKVSEDFVDTLRSSKSLCDAISRLGVRITFTDPFSDEKEFHFLDGCIPTEEFTKLVNACNTISECIIKNPHQGGFAMDGDGYIPVTPLVERNELVGAMNTITSMLKQMDQT